jgi:hypothetical protein
VAAAHFHSVGMIIKFFRFCHNILSLSGRRRLGLRYFTKPKLSDLLIIKNEGVPKMITGRREAFFHLAAKGF